MIEEERHRRPASQVMRERLGSRDAWRGAAAAAVLSLALGAPRLALADETQQEAADALPVAVATADAGAGPAGEVSAFDGQPDGADAAVPAGADAGPSDGYDAEPAAGEPVASGSVSGEPAPCDPEATVPAAGFDAGEPMPAIAGESADAEGADTAQEVTVGQDRGAVEAVAVASAQGDALDQGADADQPGNPSAGDGTDAGSQAGDGQDQGSDQGSVSPGATTQSTDEAQTKEPGGEVSTPEPEAKPKKKAKKKAATPQNGWWTDRTTGDTYFYKSGKRQHGWVVTRRGVKSNKKGTVSHRYWLDAKGRLARGRIVNPNKTRDHVKGAYYAYAKKNGVIFTGVARLKGTKTILLARSNGRLLSLSSGKRRGWVTTRAFDPKGKRRRYLLQRAKDGSYYVRAGYSTAGYAHYATDKGYVRTGVWKSSGRIYIANDKGRLATLKNSRAKRGWLDSSAFGRGKQRYYLYRTKGGANRGMCYALPGFSRSDYPHYTTRHGFVLRDGIYDIGSAHYLTSEDGHAEKVSSAQITMIDRAWNTPPTPSGYCAGWVENVAARAGLGRVGGDACDYYWRYCKNADMSSIKAGSIIAVPSHTHTAAGSIWGHVAVYVGNGKVRDSVHGYTRTTDLSWWVSYYGTTVKPKWGWYGNRVLG